MLVSVEFPMLDGNRCGAIPGCQNTAPPDRHNGSDCGVFMSRTADYLARDAVLNFSQQDMAYFRRRMVLEILRTSLLP